MADYYVSPPTESDLRIDSDRFAELLTIQWPGVHIDFIADPTRNHALEWSLSLHDMVALDRSLNRFVADPTDDHALEWSLALHDIALDGSLNRRGQVICLDGDVRVCAPFALWVRSVVSDDNILIFYDEGYSAHITLQEDVTVEHIAALFETVRRDLGPSSMGVTLYAS